MTIALIIVSALLVFIIVFINSDDERSAANGRADVLGMRLDHKLKQVDQWRETALKLEQNVSARIEEINEADRQIQDFDARFKRQQETIKGYQSNTAKLNDEIDRMTQSNSDLLGILEEKGLDRDENYRLLGLAEGRVSDLEQSNKRLIERTNEAEDNSEDRDEVRIELAVAQSTIKRRNEALAQQEKMVANGRIDVRAYQVQRDEWRGKFNALEAAVDPDNLLEAFIENAQQMRDRLKQDN